MGQVAFASFALLFLN